MPLSSMEIAQMNGAFQGAAMQQQQYSGMIGQGYGGGVYGGMGGNQAQADRWAGGAMNRAGAVGAPLMAGGAALMGMDSMGMGISAGMAAHEMGMGLAGSAAIGGMVMLPALAFGAAASHVGSQVFEGARQSMEMNNTLRSSYNFQNRTGGAGFNRGEMSQIGSMVRGMTESFGPGGEVSGFRELTSLTGKMGQMGFAQGVRDVREFSSRFKEMVTTLKTMAKDLNTTLEGAMEFAHAAKQSGVFGMKGMQQFTHAATMGATATGFAVSEFTAASLTGSQISRSVGGLGRQGAGAGITTMNQIGMAMKTGVLNEEDIYNSTGLTGAEGRQAYAGAQMQRAASFYQSGRGRRMLASMAGRNGSLDEGGVQELLAGGMGISETMTRSSGLRDRANFIRNEGRLRGAAMERLGGLGPVQQMKQWMESKGLDLSIDNDRASLFLQRQMGLGRDEADSMMKQMQNLPQQLAAMRTSESNKGLSDDLAQHNKQRGIEGIKNRFDQAKTVVNNKFQKVGSAIFDEAGRQFEEYFNGLSGKYAETMNEQADAAYRSFMAGNKSAFSTFTGGTGVSRKYSGGTFGDFTKGGSGAGTIGSILGGQSMMSKYQSAGFGFGDVAGMAPGAAQDRALRNKLSMIGKMESAANQRPSDSLIALGSSNSGWMNDYYANNLAGLSGAARMNKIEEGIKARAKTGDQSAIAAMAQLNRAGNSADKVRIISGMEHGAGITESAQLGAGGFMSVEGGGRGGYTESIETAQRRAGEMLGIGVNNIMYKTAHEDVHETFDKMGVSNEYRNPLSAALYALKVGGHAAARLLYGAGEDMKAAQSAGAMLQTPEMQALSAGMSSSDKATRAAARQTATVELQKLTAKGVDQESSDTVARRAVLSGMKAGGEYRTNMSEAEAERALSANGIDKGDMSAKERLKQTWQATLGGASGIEATLAATRYAGARATEDLKHLSTMGLAQIEEGPATGKQAHKLVVRLSASLKEKLGGIKGGTQALMLGMGILRDEENTADITGIDTSTPEGQARFAKAQQDRMRQTGARKDEERMASAGMSDEDLKKYSLAMAGTGIGQQAAVRRANRENIGAGFRRGGAAGAVAGGLGISLSSHEREIFGQKMAKTAAGYQEQLGAQTGILEEKLAGKHLGDSPEERELREKIRNYTIYAKAGDKAHAGIALEGIQESGIVKKHAGEQDKAAEEAKNPLQAEIRNHVKELAEHMKRTSPNGITRVQIMNATDIIKAALDAEKNRIAAADPNAGASGK